VREREEKLIGTLTRRFKRRTYLAGDAGAGSARSHVVHGCLGRIHLKPRRPWRRGTRARPPKVRSPELGRGTSAWEREGAGVA
jgi:hypothetical protein